MDIGSVQFPQPVTLMTAVLEIVVKAGGDPQKIFAVLDLNHAEIMNGPKPNSRLERLVILFTDWTFIHVDIDSSKVPRQ